MISEQTVIAATFLGVVILFSNKIKGIVRKKQMEYIRSIKKDIVKAKIAKNKSIEVLKEIKLQEIKTESEVVFSIQETQSIIEDIYKDNEERIQNAKLQIIQQEQNKLKHLRSLKLKTLCETVMSQILEQIKMQSKNIETESLGKSEISEIKKYFE